MKDDVKDVLNMLGGSCYAEISCHPLMFLLRVIVIPVFIFYFIVPSINAIDFTFRGAARFQQYLGAMIVFTVLIAYLVVGYIDARGVLYAIHAKVNKLGKVFISLMLVVDVVMIGSLIVLIIQLKAVGV